jgi:hypothetical protein
MDERLHLLICLSEECAEISEQCSRLAVRVSKALRFGLQDVESGQPLTAVQRIAIEIADLVAVYEILSEAGIVGPVQVDRKKRKLAAFVEYAKQCGTISEASDEPST